MYTRERADQYIRQEAGGVNPQFRLNYHLMGECGWINDPNGFIHFDGQYHLFYQHYPYQSVWGPMHWGHAVSRDLMHWSYLPVALAPDREFDRSGCFSGSAIERDGKLYLMYTGHAVTGERDTDYVQTQGIAVSEDGVLFEKWAGNPVIPASQIPQGVSVRDFRDPKVFERDGQYYAVLGSNDGAGHGLILLYRSPDLLHWEYVNVLARSRGDLGDNWECPDLFTLGGQDVLMLSPQRVPAQGDDYRNLHSTAYMLGQLDTGRGTFEYSGVHPVDYGFDFYAPQTTQDALGRRIMIAWMDMWESAMPTQQGHGWAGAMTLPREVLLQEGRLLFRPVQETEACRGELTAVQELLIAGEQELGLQGDSYELMAVFEARDAEEFGLKLRTDPDGREETVLSYRLSDGRFSFNRDRSGIGPGGERRTCVELADGRLELRIFVDKSSVEVFIGDGEKVMTGRIYPGPDSLGIRAFSRGGACLLRSLKMWELR